MSPNGPNMEARHYTINTSIDSKTHKPASTKFHNQTTKTQKYQPTSVNNPIMSNQRMATPDTCRLRFGPCVRGETECQVCLDPIVPDTETVTHEDCGRTICADCFFTWLEESGTCCNCRAVLADREEGYDSDFSYPDSTSEWHAQEEAREEGREEVREEFEEERQAIARDRASLTRQRAALTRQRAALTRQRAALILQQESLARSRAAFDRGGDFARAEEALTGAHEALAKAQKALGTAREASAEGFQMGAHHPSNGPRPLFGSFGPSPTFMGRLPFMGSPSNGPRPLFPSGSFGSPPSFGPPLPPDEPVQANLRQRAPTRAQATGAQRPSTDIPQPNEPVEEDNLIPSFFFDAPSSPNESVSSQDEFERIRDELIKQRRARAPETGAEGSSEHTLDLFPSSGLTFGYRS